MCRVPDSLLESVWICWGWYKNQTCLIFFTTVTNPLVPPPTNIPVSDFLRHSQTQNYTIIGRLRLPGTVDSRSALFSPIRSGLNPRSIPDPPCKRKNKNRPLLSEEIVISPRKSEEVSDLVGMPQTWLVLNSITIVA